MRSILLATDLTPQSDRALGRALRLAGPNGKVTVFHTLEVVAYAPSDDGHRLEAEAKLARLLKGYPAEQRTISMVIRTGDPVEEIVRVARSSDADLVVMGTHRASLLGDMFGEGTAPQVAEAGTVPVLTVSDPAVEDYRSLIVGIDDSQASEQALAAALTLFPDTPIVVVHGFHVPFGGFLESSANREAVGDQHHDALMARIRSVGQRIGRTDLADRIDLRLRDGDTIAVLNAEIRHTGADLLVLGTSGSGNRLFGGVASAVAHAPPCDLLIVPSLRPAA